MSRQGLAGRWVARGITLAGAALVATALAGPATLRAETLGDALVSAYTHSGLLEQNRALLRAADEDVAVAMAALRPVINWTSEISRSFGTTRSANTGGTVRGFATDEMSFNIVAELTLYDFGRNRLAIDAAKESVLSAREGLIGVEQQVLFRAVSAYMEVRRALEIVALRQSNVRLITQELRAARDRFEVGEVTRTDVALAEARLASARANLAVAQGDLEVARAEYAAAVGRKPGQLQTPRALPALPGETAARDTALRSHPSMRRAQHEVTVAEINIARAEAAMKPTVTLEGRLGVTESLDGPNFTRGGSVSLGASGPIYQGGRLTALMRQAIARRDAARGNLHVVRHTVAQDVANAYARLTVARAAREATERQVRAATVAFRGVREEATLGARTTLDVLNAEQELLDARASQISAMIDEYIAGYAVLASMGALTAEHLKLGVQRYDPVAYYNHVRTAPPLRSKEGQKLDRVLRAIGND